MHQRRQGWIWLVGWVAGLLAAAALSVPALAQDDPTPTPTPEADLQAMAQVVHKDNIRNGNFTQWRGGDLGENDDAMPGVSYGGKMPGFALRDAVGRPVILDRLDGPKLINFWASWCAPCEEEFPLLSEAARRADAPFRVVFVNVWDDEHAFADFAAANPDLVIVRDVGDVVNAGLDVIAIPTSLLIDADGTVHVVHVGTVTPPVMALLEALAGALGE